MYAVNIILYIYMYINTPSNIGISWLISYTPKHPPSKRGPFPRGRAPPSTAPAPRDHLPCRASFNGSGAGE